MTALLIIITLIVAIWIITGLVMLSGYLGREEEIHEVGQQADEAEKADAEIEAYLAEVKTFLNAQHRSTDE